MIWEIARTGKEHDLWRLGTTVQLTIPRHKEINQLTAEGILKDTERELGKRWWR